MNNPKMILFDYGGTLMYEPDFETFNGNKAIYPYICENSHIVRYFFLYAVAYKNLIFGVSAAILKY